MEDDRAAEERQRIEEEVPALISYLQSRKRSDLPKMDPAVALEEEIEELIPGLQNLLLGVRSLRRTQALHALANDIADDGKTDGLLREMAKGELERAGAATGEGSIAGAGTKLAQLIQADSEGKVDRLQVLLALRDELTRRANH